MEEKRRKIHELEEFRAMGAAEEDFDVKKEDRVDQKECDIEGKLRLAAEGTEVPDSLRPESVERMLGNRKKESQKRKYSRAWRYGTAAAACLCLTAALAGAYFLGGEGAAEGVLSDYGALNAEEASGQSTEPGEGNESSGAAADGIMLATAENYDEIYEYILDAREYETLRMRNYSVEDFAGSGSASDGAVVEESRVDYSDTNVRQEGVGEADTVKTDGKSLFILNDSTVDIVGIRAEKMEHLAEIRAREWETLLELYLEDDRLVLLYSRSDYEEGENGNDGVYLDYTCADVYDVSNPAEPVLLDGISQSGYYNTMRVKDGYVYVFSSFYADVNAGRDEVSAYVPEADGRAITSDCIYMPQVGTGNRYTVISSFALDNPGEKTDSKAVFGSTGMCYVSGENIYIAESLYGETDVSRTSIRKLSYGEGKISGTAQTKIDGHLDDSFCIDEYDGYLRIVATVRPVEAMITDGQFPSARSGAEDGTAETDDVQAEGAETTSLYVLDGELEPVGEITDLAPGEQVYSARFMGDTGYFVTFKQIDPLFSVDLSDPRSPKIIGELKIPGFSEYLHPYGEGLLLGIGMDVDEEGMTTEGGKLSMFDISDPSDVKEKDQMLLSDTYGVDVYDYRTVFIDVQKNLFGFTTYGDQQIYHLFSYDPENGFTEEAAWNLEAYGNVRGLYAGDHFYLVANNTVVRYTLDGFEKTDDLVML